MSGIFVSQGADPLHHLRQRFSKVNSPVFEGQWGIISLQPDLFSPQKFIVGIVVHDESGRFAYRLIQDGKKFGCLYAKAHFKQIKELLQSAEYSLNRALKNGSTISKVEFEADNIVFSPFGNTSGQSREQTLNRLFSDVVAMEASAEQCGEFVSLDTKQVRLLVANELKKISGLLYERIAVEEDTVTLADETSGEPHRVDINLRPDGAAGSVVSAVFQTRTTIELNLLRSSRDLVVYGRARKIDNLGLFVMSAKEDQYEEREFTKLNELLDEQSWRLEKQGLKVVVFDEPMPLARSIYDWAVASQTN